jgi:hypothetical protein
MKEVSIEYAGLGRLSTARLRCFKIELFGTSPDAISPALIIAQAPI